MSKIHLEVIDLQTGLSLKTTVNDADFWIAVPTETMISGSVSPRRVLRLRMMEPPPICRVAANIFEDKWQTAEEA